MTLFFACIRNPKTPWVPPTGLSPGQIALRVPWEDGRSEALRHVFSSVLLHCGLMDKAEAAARIIQEDPSLRVPRYSEEADHQQALHNIAFADPPPASGLVVPGVRVLVRNISQQNSFFIGTVLSVGKPQVAVGMYVEAALPDGRLMPASIIELAGEDCVKIHFEGMSPGFDEILSLSSARLHPIMYAESHGLQLSLSDYCESIASEIYQSHGVVDDTVLAHRAGGSSVFNSTVGIATGIVQEKIPNASRSPSTTTEASSRKESISASNISTSTCMEGAASAGDDASKLHGKKFSWRSFLKSKKAYSLHPNLLTHSSNIQHQVLLALSNDTVIVGTDEGMNYCAVCNDVRLFDDSPMPRLLTQLRLVWEQVERQCPLDLANKDVQTRVRSNAEVLRAIAPWCPRITNSIFMPAQHLQSAPHSFLSLHGIDDLHIPQLELAATNATKEIPRHLPSKMTCSIERDCTREKSVGTRSGGSNARLSSTESPPDEDESWLPTTNELSKIIDFLGANCNVKCLLDRLSQSAGRGEAIVQCLLRLKTIVLQAPSVDSVIIALWWVHSVLSGLISDVFTLQTASRKSPRVAGLPKGLNNIILEAPGGKLDEAGKIISPDAHDISKSPLETDLLRGAGVVGQDLVPIHSELVALLSVVGSIASIAYLPRNTEALDMMALFATRCLNFSFGVEELYHIFSGSLLCDMLGWLVEPAASLKPSWLQKMSPESMTPAQNSTAFVDLPLNHNAAACRDVMDATHCYGAGLEEDDMDITSEATVQTSSNLEKAAKILDGKPNTSWESTDATSHWVQFVCKQPIRAVCLEFARLREAPPVPVVVWAGASPSELLVVRSTSVSGSRDSLLFWIALPKEYPCVRVHFETQSSLAVKNARIWGRPPVFSRLTSTHVSSISATLSYPSMPTAATSMVVSSAPPPLITSASIDPSPMPSGCSKLNLRALYLNEAGGVVQSLFMQIPLLDPGVLVYSSLDSKKSEEGDKQGAAGINNTSSTLGVPTLLVPHAKRLPHVALQRLHSCLEFILHHPSLDATIQQAVFAATLNLVQCARGAALRDLLKTVTQLLPICASHARGTALATIEALIKAGSATGSDKEKGAAGEYDMMGRHGKDDVPHALAGMVVKVLLDLAGSSLPVQLCVAHESLGSNALVTMREVLGYGHGPSPAFGIDDARLVSHILRRAAEGSLGPLWQQEAESELLASITRVSFADDVSIHPVLLSRAFFWRSLAAFCLLKPEQVNAVPLRQKESRIHYCTNHEDDTTIAIVACSFCGDLCALCDTVLHRRLNTRNHTRTPCRTSMVGITATAASVTYDTPYMRLMLDREEFRAQVYFSLTSEVICHCGKYFGGRNILDALRGKSGSVWCCANPHFDIVYQGLLAEVEDDLPEFN